MPQLRVLMLQLKKKKKKKKIPNDATKAWNIQINYKKNFFFKEYR